MSKNFASAIETLIGGTADTFVVCSGAGVVVAQKTAAEVRTLLSVYTSAQTDSAIAAAVASLVDSSPAALDTLNELAAALGDDANFSTTVTNALAGKASTSHTHTASDVTDFNSAVAANSAVSANTAKVSNATHTGDVVGSTTLTISNGAVTAEKTSITGTPNGTKFLRDDWSWQSSSGGSPGGSSGEIQYNNAGAFGGTTAIVYAGSGTHYTITCQSSTTIGSVIKAAASQTANLTEWQSSGGTAGAKVNASREFSNTKGISLAECFGAGATVSGSGYSVAFGNAASATGYGASAFGYLARATGANYPTAIGEAVLVSANYSTGLGALCVADHASSTVVGYGSRCYASNQFVAGSSDCPHSSIFFGSGVTAPTPISYVINGTGGSGTNIAGGSVTIAGGKGTGNATPGTVIIQCSVAGASGTTLQTLAECAKFDGNTTAGETRFLLWDIDAGTLKRVSIGAANSGGSGYKVLRVPN